MGKGKIPERRDPNNTNEQVNGEANIIRISGKKEKCEAAAEALRALVPMSAEVNVATGKHKLIRCHGGRRNHHTNVLIKVPKRGNPDKPSRSMERPKTSGSAGRRKSVQMMVSF